MPYGIVIEAYLILLTDVTSIPLMFKNVLYRNRWTASEGFISAPPVLSHRSPSAPVPCHGAFVINFKIETCEFSNFVLF